MSDYRTGRTKAIREFVAAHPGTTSKAIAAAVGGAAQDICRALWRLVEQGELVTDTRQAFQTHHYSIAPPSTPKPRKKQAPPSKASKHAMSCAIAPKTIPNRPDRETSEDFIARGGKIERLPSVWDSRPTIGPPHVDASFEHSYARHTPIRTGGL